MKKFILVAALLFVFGDIASAQTVKQKVAVYVTGDAENSIKKVIGSKLVTGITRSEGYAAVERTADFLAELTKEQDYQMSGAVSDNQIARLGQQFGVRFVLVADLSEVFEQMFVSARMIDVQTAQITNSTEESAVVANMDSLTKLAESIVLKLFYITNFATDDIKILGPFSDAKSLYDVKVPSGYHIASIEEVNKVIRNNQILKRSSTLPVYTEIESTRSMQTQHFTVNYYSNNSSYNIKDSNTETRYYYKYTISYILVNGLNNNSNASTFYNDDNEFYYYYNKWNHLATSTERKVASTGLYNMTYNASITAGYVYAIKD